jgi:zinc transport system ATP-binding protein
MQTYLSGIEMYTLEVYWSGEQIFTSSGRWLYPLFELEIFLDQNDYPPSEVLVNDKIVGRAAALMLVHLGIRHISAGILSVPGREILDCFETDYRYETLIERVSCRTEELLGREDDPGRAYRILRERARL